MLLFISATGSREWLRSGRDAKQLVGFDIDMRGIVGFVEIVQVETESVVQIRSPQILRPASGDTLLRLFRTRSSCRLVISQHQP